MAIDKEKASALIYLLHEYYEFVNRESNFLKSIYNVFCGLYKIRKYNSDIHVVVILNKETDGKKMDIDQVFNNFNHTNNTLISDQHFLIRRSDATITINDLDTLCCNDYFNLSQFDNYSNYNQKLDALCNYSVKCNDYKGDDRNNAYDDHKSDDHFDIDGDELSFFKLAKETVVRRLNNHIYIYNHRYFWKVCVSSNLHFYHTTIFYIECNPHCMTKLYYNDNNLLKLIKVLFKFVTNYSMLISLIIDILLIIDVYSDDDTIFFVVSIIAVCVPLCVSSIYICHALVCCRKKKDEPSPFSQQVTKLESIDAKLHLLPILNIPYYLGFGNVRDSSDTRAALISMLLQATMTYPLYLINLSYLLESKIENYHDISIFNYLQLLSSLIVLCVAPFTNLLTFLNESYLKVGLILSLRDKLISYMIIGFYIFPAMIIEIIHFFPLLFAYYVDHAINLNQLWIILGIFNLPKIGFMIHIIRKQVKLQVLNNLHHEKVVLALTSAVIIALFVILPLVPYMLIMLQKNNVKRNSSDQYQFKCNVLKKSIFVNGFCNSLTNYYWHITGYLWISYGVSCLTLWILSHNNLSNFVIGSIFTVLLLCTLMTISIPCTWYYVKKVAPFGLIRL